MKTNYKNYNRGKREETKPVDEVSEEVDVLCVLEVGSEVTVVDLRIDTTSEFYKVITGAGIEG